jgi:FkbM family methyltransferase
MSLMSFKQTIKNFILARNFFSNKFTIMYAVRNDLLPNIFTSVTSKKIREILFLPSSRHITQLNQDLFALIVNKFKKNGYFIEIGANNGFDLSNTIYLEENFNWNGILIEANPAYKKSLAKRKSIIVNKAISDKAGSAVFRKAGLYGGLEKFLDKKYSKHIKNKDTIIVKTISINEIFEKYTPPSIIDFISIDVEGAELMILKQVLAIKNHRFKCGCIEHNYRKKDQKIFKKVLEEKKYKVTWESKTGHDLFFIDSIIKE